MIAKNNFKKEIPIIDHRSLYRIPWNMSDNPTAWLEPTTKCNLACDGCYRKNTKRRIKR